MKLLQLTVGDEFKLGEFGDDYKLVPSDDQEFLATGQLRVENQRTKRKALLPEDTEVMLINVA